MDTTIDIAVIGATGLVGSAVLEHLSESNISAGQIYPLASDDSETVSVSFGNKHLSVHPLSEFDFNKVQLCFFCVPAEVVRATIEKAVAANCYCIDFSEHSRLKDGVPLVVAGVNDQELEELQGRVVASPDSSIAHLACILAPLMKLGVIERVTANLMRAVSEHGRKAIDELSEQSIALFNLKPINTRYFGQQIAFNVLPHACQTPVSDGKTGMNARLQEELRKVLGDKALLFNSFLTQVPVFFGHSLVIQLEFATEHPITKIVDLIINTSELHLIDQEMNSPSAVGNAVNQPGVYLGPIQQDPTWPQGINLWATADNINQGAAINGVQLAEILVKGYL